LVSNASVTDHDELEHTASRGSKHHQAAFFDQRDEDFEISRPHDTPALYKWLLDEKFRRGTEAIRHALATSNALVVCGGSGMDAEYLARAGAHVINSDISIGAALRSQTRARRYDLPIEVLVADVEQLPFRDQEFGLVYVHDGLHHLDNPLAGLLEMTRVTNEFLSVNEPSSALVTRFAVALGLALDKEESGNLVARLDLDELRAQLEAQGFQIAGGHRYAMYYKHHPGRLMAALSRPPVLGFAKWIVQLVDASVGRIGNKLTVQAVRSSAATAVRDKLGFDGGTRALR
jgi:SAM-dependent methyltransferase